MKGEKLQSFGRQGFWIIIMRLKDWWNVWASQKAVPDVRRCSEGDVTRRVARSCEGVRSSGIGYSEKGEKCYHIDAADRWDCSVENIEKRHLEIMEKLVLHTSDRTSSIFHKNSEIMSTWIFRASEEDNWSNTETSFKKFSQDGDDEKEQMWVR